MRCLNWYVTKSFLITFFMAILILTFAMTGANMIKALEFIARGVPLSAFCKYILYLLPRVLTFTVPWAVMVSVVLIFGRMSADNEITAMRACGISIMQILSPLLVMTFVLTAFCLYLQVEIGPPLLWKSRSLLNNEAMLRPTALFAPGSPFSHHMGNGNMIVITVDDRIGDNELKGVLFFQTDERGNIQQEINATRGTINTDTDSMIIRFDLFDCMFTDRRENSQKGVSRGYAEKLSFEFNYGKQVNAERISERAKYMPVTGLLGEIRRTKVAGQDTTRLEIELNKRIAFALSPIAFLLLGMPLAIRTSRRETSIGIFISIILAAVYFFSIILFESLDNVSWIYPQYLLWIPNIVFQIIGAVMTYRISQR